MSFRNRVANRKASVNKAHILLVQPDGELRLRNEDTGMRAGSSMGQKCFGEPKLGFMIGFEYRIPDVDHRSLPE